MLGELIKNLFDADLKLETSVFHFLEKKYFPPGNLPLFTAFLPKSVKLIFYFSLLSLLFFLIKIIYPENKIISLIILSVLLTSGFLLVLIFLGFMQLLYG
jgi:hypothetical protein